MVSVVAAVRGTLSSAITVTVPPRAGRTNGRIPPPPPRTGGGDGPDDDAASRGPLLDNLRLAILFFMGAEVMFFAGLVSGFLVLRTSAPVWPPPLQPRLPVAVTGLNTLVLLASSVAMHRMVRAIRRGDRVELVRRLGLVAVLGVVFLVIQGFEWVRLVAFGLTIGSSAYGTTFYTIIGTHAVHVLGALVWVGVSLVLAARGRFSPEHSAPLRACAMYWHFVVGLWPILYVAVYLL
jgi:heme/copper-type cytochrome/quinol oxidase subunit 3